MKYNMKKYLSCILAAIFILPNIAFAKDDHDHDKKEHAEESHAAEKHTDEDHGDDHAEEKHAEENPQVGPDKGILQASEEQGFQLSPQAEKNFEIQRVKISSLDRIEIPSGALVTAGIEKNIYRFRAGFYKRIDFVLKQRVGAKMYVHSSDFKNGDEIVTAGMGFLRIAEIAAFDGAPEGHSH